MPDQPAPPTAKPPASTDNNSNGSSNIWRNPVVVAAVVAASGAIVAAIIAGLFSFTKDAPKEKFVLAGYVFSNKKVLIKRARLTLAIEGQTAQTKTSNEQGGFFFSQLPSLYGELEVSADGYESKTLPLTPPYSSVPVELFSSADTSSQIPQTGTSHDVVDCGNSGENKANPSIARDEANHGWWYETGQIGNSPDYAKAMSCYLKAVEHGDIIANWNIGRLYEHGLGVQQDAETAKLWYKKAADQGDARSQDYIRNIGHNP